MEDPLELTPPPSLGNLPASLPFAISMERTFPRKGAKVHYLLLSRASWQGRTRPNRVAAKTDLGLNDARPIPAHSEVHGDSPGALQGVD